MIIGKHFVFDSSHQLPDEECYGKCRHLHGHTYHLIIKVEGLITGKGWVCNFKNIKEIVNIKVINELDHKHINDVIEDITTAENICHWIYNQISTPINAMGVKLHSIILYETPTSFAEMLC